METPSLMDEVAPNGCPADLAVETPSLMDEVAPNGCPAVWYFYNDKMKRTGTAYNSLSSRCLSMVRPGIDYVILPRANKHISENLACALMQKKGFTANQIIWIEKASLEDSKEDHAHVLATVEWLLPHHNQLVFCPWAVTPQFLNAIEAFNVASCGRAYSCFGDCLTKSVTKSWLHPCADPTDSQQQVPKPSSYRHGIRVPRGYAFSTPAGLRRAYELLLEDGVAQMFFKPAFTSGGNGITRVSCLDDLEAIDMKTALEDVFMEVGGVSDEVKLEYGFDVERNPPFILEEGITSAPGMASPVLLALGKVVLPCCDQIMAGMKHGGNRYPSQLPQFVQQRCADAFSKLQAELNQSGFWGVDFVIEAGTLEPVLVDLNMARPNGNHYFQLFRDALPVRPPIWAGRRANFSQAVEQGIDFAAVLAKLEETGIALDFSTGCGVGMVQVAKKQSVYSTKVFVGAKSDEEFDRLNAVVDHILSTWVVPEEDTQA